MRPLNPISLSLIAALLGAGCSSMPSLYGPAAPATVSDGVWVDGAGMTLYTFDKDMAGSGKSVCHGPCAVNWPPLKAEGAAAASGDWSVVARDDGGRQWAYKGHPVYRWVKDQKPGDRTGDGVNGVWKLARP